MFSHNEEELIQWGQRLGTLLQAGDVLILTGDLGAGKTTFTKGLALGLGISQMIKSPTYTMFGNTRVACHSIIWMSTASEMIQTPLIWMTFSSGKALRSLNGESC